MDRINIIVEVYQAATFRSNALRVGNRHTPDRLVRELQVRAQCAW
jgi:hypothetical protein